jgi:hypothetical protein
MAAHTQLESLRSGLSKDATIYTRADFEFATHAARWSEYKAPSAGVVVNVASEADVVETVRSLLVVLSSQSCAKNFGAGPVGCCKWQEVSGSIGRSRLDFDVEN